MDANTFDSSSLKTYVACPRKYYWRYVRHLLKKGPKSPPLSFGTAIHEALRLWYIHHDIELVVDAFHDLWDERFSDKKRTHDRGEALLRGYAKRYDQEHFTWISEPETTFNLDLNGSTFVGRFDGIVNFQGTPLVIDHKTATKYGSTYFYQFRPDMQMSAYVWAANQLYEETIEGALINVLYFTTRQIDYYRSLINRQAWEIQEFLDVATRNIAEIRSKDVTDHTDWEPRWSFCQHWGTCPYRDLCTEKDPEPLIQSMYRVEEWDPEEEFDIDKKRKKLKEYVEEPKLWVLS